jgi:hypothetical protein
MTGNQKLFYASLFGSKLAGMIPRVAAVENELMKHVVPVVPFLPVRNEVNIRSAEHPFNSTDWTADAPNIEGQFFPLLFRKRSSNQEEWYTFPYEPMVSISGANIIAKKAPAKANNFIGTVKERWSQDDYEITITGSIVGARMVGKMEDCFPREDFERLRDYCTAPEGLDVRCEPLQLLGINSLVVESFVFPFSRGENVQAYELKCYSDFTSELLLEIE